MREFPGNAVVALAVAAGIILPAGCASYPPPKEAIPNFRSYGNSYDDVWDSVLASLSEANIGIRSENKRSGAIVAEDRTIPLRQYEPGRYDSKYSFCGSPQMYHVLRDLVGEYKVSVAPASVGQTSVKIDASYMASVYSEEQFTGWLPCPSKGSFEPFFLEGLTNRLNRKITPVPTRSIPRREPSRKLDWWKPAGP